MKLVQHAVVIGATLGLVLTPGPARTHAAALPASRWRIVYTSQVSNSNLSQVAAAGRSSAWAIGDVQGGRTILLRWNGSHWRWVKQPGPASFQADELAAAGRDDLWLVGLNTRAGAQAFRFNGIAWHDVPWPQIAGPGQPIILGPSDVWFAGGWSCTVIGGRAQSCTTSIWHWNGHTWTPQVFNKAVVGMGGISGHLWLAALTFVRFPGGNGNPAGRLALFRLNGRAWQRLAFSSARVYGFFVTVAASSARDLWVVARPLRQTVRQSGVFHFNGRAWAELQVPPAEPTQLVPVLPDGRGGVWLGPWARWTGRRWVNTIPVAGFPRVDCFSVNGLSAIPGSSDVWGAGWAHRIGSIASDQFNAMIAIYGRPHRSAASHVSPARRALPVCVVGARPSNRSSLAPASGRA